MPDKSHRATMLRLSQVLNALQMHLQGSVDSCFTWSRDFRPQLVILNFYEAKFRKSSLEEEAARNWTFQFLQAGFPGQFRCGQERALLSIVLRSSQRRSKQVTKSFLLCCWVSILILLVVGLDYSRSIVIALAFGPYEGTSGITVLLGYR